MSKPQGNQGDKQQGMAMVQLAIQVLGQAVSKLGVLTEEGQAVLSALKSLSKKTGQKGQEAQSLMPAQIEMMKNAAGGGPDVAKVLAMQRGAGGGAPPGAGGPFMQ